MAKKLLNATEAAKLLRISRPTFKKACDEGHVTVAKRDKSGPKFDPEILTAEWEKRAEYSRLQSRHIDGCNRGGRPSKRPGAKTIPGEEDVEAKLKGLSEADKYVKARALRETFAAQKEYIVLQQMRGELVSIEEVRKSGADLGVTVMTKLAALPDRVCASFAAMTDQHEIREMLQAEIDQVILDIRESCGAPELE